MLLLAAAIWGMGTVVIKGTVDSFSPLWLVGLRFLSAGIILGLVCARRLTRTLNRDTLASGAFLGVFIALAFCCNATGLTDTTASKSSFLTATYCVIVPFLAWGISRIRPTRYNLFAALLCITGVAFVSFSGSSEALSLGFGDAITLLSALFLGLHLAFSAKLSETRDALTLTVVQFLVGGALASAAAFLAEGAFDPLLLTDPSIVGGLAYLVVFASCLALSLQNVGVAHVPAAPASLFLATESVFGLTFSLLILGETVTVPMIAGFVLIGGAIVVSETFPLKKTRLDASEALGEKDCESREA